MRTLILWLALSAIAFAQPIAKITGPTEAPAGELVVLSSNGSTGDNLIWVRPETLQSVQAGCDLLDTQVFFATTKLGKYEFWLIAADKEARISYARHTVEVKQSIGGPINPGPVDPPPKDPPTVPNPSKWAKLNEVSKQGADAAKDGATRSHLKSSIAATILAIDSRCASGQCPTIQEAKSMVLKSIEGVLLARSGPSALIDWTLWRRGNQAELDRLGIVDLADYVAAVKAIASGL